MTTPASLIKSLLSCTWMGGGCYPAGYWAMLSKVLGIAVMMMIILLIWWLYKYGGMVYIEERN